MKTILKTLLIFSILLILSCEKEDATINNPTNIKKVESVELSQRLQQIYNSKSALTYLGGNRWSGLWGGVNVTFSGCAPEVFASNTLCYFEALYAENGQVYGNNQGYVSIVVTGLAWIQFPAYDGITFYNHELAVGSSGNVTIVNFPYKIIKVDNKPVLVHPAYSGSDLPEAPE